MFQANYNTAQNNAASLTPYSGQLTAGFTPTQLQAQQSVTNIANDGTYGANNNAAIGDIQGVTGNIPKSNITPTAVTAGQLSSTNLSPYMNPYTNDVINTTMAQLNQQQGQTLAGQAASEANNGAFGGSRSGVAQALTNQYYNQDDASTIAGLNSSNYAQAQQGALNDINNNLAAQEFNSGQNMTAQQANFTNSLNANNQQLTAAGDMQTANNNALQTATDQAGLLSSVGDAQQQQNQTAINNAYQAYMNGQQLTLQQQNLLNSALGMIPIQQTITGASDGSSTTHQSGGLTGMMGGMLGGLGSLGSGLGAMGVML
ncbi:MAG TPA: hypothetical protein VGH23_20500 [Rhizomicrobium sp.]